MNAYDFIFECIKPYLCDEGGGIAGRCSRCKRCAIVERTAPSNDMVCLVCGFLAKPNAKHFGMLTGVRPHCPISFINSLLVFEQDVGLTLVLSEKYSRVIPSDSYIKYMVYDIQKYIIKLLDNPKPRVIIKPSIRLEDYATDLVMSDERCLCLVSPKGGYTLNVDVWNSLIKLIKLNDKQISLQAIEYLRGIAIGNVLNTDAGLRGFVAANLVLMTRFNDLLSMDIHSRLFILNLLRLVCDDA